jgi:hypothetical protein
MPPIRRRIQNPGHSRLGIALLRLEVEERLRLPRREDLQLRDPRRTLFAYAPSPRARDPPTPGDPYPSTVSANHVSPARTRD